MSLSIAINIKGELRNLYIDKARGATRNTSLRSPTWIVWAWDQERCPQFKFMNTSGVSSEWPHPG